MTVREQLEAKYGKPASTGSVRSNLEAKYGKASTARATLQPTQTTTPPVTKQTLAQKIWAGIAKRSENVGAIADKYGAGKQGLLSSAYQTAGQAAGALGDIGFEAIKSVTPEVIKKPLAAGVEKIAGTETVQDLASKYRSWKEQNPEAAANLEATVNISTVLPIGKTAQVGVKEAGKVAGKLGTKIEKGAIEATEQAKSSFAKDLVSPVKTKAVKEAEVARTTETGKGIFKKSVITPTKYEQKAIDAVKNVEGISSKNTFQQNYNIIQSEVSNLAKKLESDLKANNFVISRKQIVANLEKAKNKLIAESPLITGDAEKMAGKLIEGAKKIINESSGTAEGILSARKKFDSWVKSQKPNVFDAKSEGALTIANREIRNVFNDMLERKAPNVGVKDSLSKQSALYTALENIAPKAAEEADSAIGRAMQSIGKVLGTKNKAVQATAAAVGIGGLGAAATFAPIVAGAGIPVYLVYKAGKFVFKPEVRKAVANVLKEIESKTKTLTDPIQIKELNKANEELKKYLGDIQPGLSMKAVGQTADLLQEAKKYKSAEEFVKAKQNAFHGTDAKGFKYDPKKSIFLTDDFDTANTYAGYSAYSKPTGEVVPFHAKEGKTLDLNKTDNVKKVFQEIYGSPELKRAYNQIPETYKYLDDYGDVRYLEPKSSQSDFEDWLMMEYQSKPTIQDGLKVRTGSYSFEKSTQDVRKQLQDAFSVYGKPSRQSVYNRWEDLMKYGKEKGYDYIKHTTESPDTSIVFPETIALNPEKSLLTKSQLIDIWNKAHNK